MAAPCAAVVARAEDGSFAPSGPRVAERIAVELEQALGLDKAGDLHKPLPGKIDRRTRQTAAATMLQGVTRQRATASVCGFGAPAKATTLLYHFGIGPEDLDFIVDDSPIKQGLYSPGMHIPVVPSSALYDRKPDACVVLAWNFAQPIMGKHQAYKDAGGTFIVPLPDVEVF